MINTQFGLEFKYINTEKEFEYYIADVDNPDEDKFESFCLEIKRNSAEKKGVISFKFNEIDEQVKYQILGYIIRGEFQYKKL